jgi:hypothetical protein
MNLSFIKNKLLTLFAIVGVVITLLPLSLEAGILGQWCSNENNLGNYRYRCGNFWQALQCQSYYDTRCQQCLYQDRSCCNPSGKSSEKPYYNSGDSKNNAAINPDVWKKADGTWIHPERNGFEGSTTFQSIPVGTRLDRYGTENGNYLSPAGTPYEQRSLPPDTNPNDYHVYEVIKAIPVESGQIAAWFGQPGGGVQHYTKGIGNVAYLRSQEYLKEIKP